MPGYIAWIYPLTILNVLLVFLSSSPSHTLGTSASYDLPLPYFEVWARSNAFLIACRFRTLLCDYFLNTVAVCFSFFFFFLSFLFFFFFTIEWYKIVFYTSLPTQSLLLSGTAIAHWFVEQDFFHFFSFNEFIQWEVLTFILYMCFYI